MKNWNPNKEYYTICVLYIYICLGVYSLPYTCIKPCHTKWDFSVSFICSMYECSVMWNFTFQAVLITPSIEGNSGKDRWMSQTEAVSYKNWQWHKWKFDINSTFVNLFVLVPSIIWNRMLFLRKETYSQMCWMQNDEKNRLK